MIANPGIFLPDNRSLGRAIRDLPRPLARYADHARLIASFIAVRTWTRQADADGWVGLHSKHLDRFIPERPRPKLLAALVDAGAIEKRPHAAGLRATGFRFAPGFDGPPVRHALRGRLAEKVARWRDGRDRDPAELERLAALGPIVPATRAALAALSFDARSAALAAQLPDVNAEHLAYIAGAIEAGDAGEIGCDAFGHRLHTIATQMARPLRKRLRIDGAETVEIDISNSQPTILAISLENPGFQGAEHNRTIADHNRHAEHMAPACLLSGVGDRGPCCLAGNRSFRLACETGVIYDQLAQAAGLDRATAKQQVFVEVLFGRTYYRGKVRDAFGRLWPDVLEAIDRLKAGDYRNVARVLQRGESALVLRDACGRLLAEHPDAKLLTVHDSLIVPADLADAADNALRAAFRAWGMNVSTHRTEPNGELDHGQE